jgi:hypothetical protein
MPRCPVSSPVTTICPSSDTAIAVLHRQRANPRAPDRTDSVFVYRGRPVHQTATAAWARALQRAGLHDFRWHDLRHTWASWHVQRGTPLQASVRSLDSSGSMPRRGLGTLNELHGGPQARRLGSCPATALPPPPGQPETVVGLHAVLITP